MRLHWAGAWGNAPAVFSGALPQPPEFELCLTPFDDYAFRFVELLVAVGVDFYESLCAEAVCRARAKCRGWRDAFDESQPGSIGRRCEKGGIDVAVHQFTAELILGHWGCVQRG